MAIFGNFFVKQKKVKLKAGKLNVKRISIKKKKPDKKEKMEKKIKFEREEKLIKEKKQKEEEEKKKKREEKIQADKEKKLKLAQEKKVKIDIRSAKKKEEGFEYIKTGVPGLDQLLGPGIPSGSSILVEGGPGNGKTILCLSLAKNMCAKGKKVLYMSFEEPRERLITHMKSFGMDPELYEKKGLLYIKRFNALDIARSVEALLSEAKKELLIDVQPVLIPPEFNPDIILVDSLSSISSAFSGESSRFRIYMEQLFRYLESHKITSFLIREVSSPSHVGSVFVESGEAVSFLSDGIVVLYNVYFKNGTRKRAIEVLKLRGGEIDRRIVQCEIIKGKGIIVSPKKLLTGDYILT